MSGKQELWINGVKDSLFEEYSLDFSSWNSGYFIDMFSDELLHHEPEVFNIGRLDPWPGTVYLLAVCDKILTEAEVAQNFEAGLHDAPPTMISSTTSVDEDGQATSHYDTPVWYETSPAAADLGIIDLTSASTDADRDQPLFPNYDENAPLSKLFFKTLPSKGDCFQEDGTPVTEAETELAGGRFKYRPLKDQFGSAYDSFELHARDGKTDERSRNDAIITLDVASVNDPPLPIYGNISSLAGVDASSVMTLSGSDIDGTVESAQIVCSSMPLHGDLFEIESDGTTFGSKIVCSGSSHSLPNMKVGYRYTGDETSPTVTGFLKSDSFSFQVRDNQGATGKPGPFDLKVFTSLSATPANLPLGDITVLEETKGEITLRGDDSSTSPRNLRYQIVSLPGNGDLFDPANPDTKLVVGSIIAAEDVHSGSAYPGVRVVYRGHKDYFNYPNKMYNDTTFFGDLDTFEYSAVVASSTSAKSLPAAQQVRVKNVNDPVELDVPEEKVGVCVLVGGGGGVGGGGRVRKCRRPPPPLPTPSFSCTSIPRPHRRNERRTAQRKKRKTPPTASSTTGCRSKEFTSQSRT